MIFLIFGIGFHFHCLKDEKFNMTLDARQQEEGLYTWSLQVDIKTIEQEEREFKEGTLALKIDGEILTLDQYPHHDLRFMAS
jgi:hypothetical protein